MFDKVAADDAANAKENEDYQYYGRLKYKAKGYMYVFEESGVKLYLSNDFKETIGVICIQNMDNMPSDTFYNLMETELKSLYGTFNYVDSYESKIGYEFKRYKVVNNGIDGYLFLCLQDDCFVGIIVENSDGKISSNLYNILDTVDVN